MCDLMRYFECNYGQRVPSDVLLDYNEPYSPPNFKPMDYADLQNNTVPFWSAHRFELMTEPITTSS